MEVVDAAVQKSETDTHGFVLKRVADYKTPLQAISVVSKGCSGGHVK